MYEGEVIHHLIATELSYVRIAITFVSSFISLLERHTKPSVQLEIAKRKPRFREERKNEEIISRNSLPHHKRASNLIKTHEAARLQFLPLLEIYFQLQQTVLLF